MKITKTHQDQLKVPTCGAVCKDPHTYGRARSAISWKTPNTKSWRQALPRPLTWNNSVTKTKFKWETWRRVSKNMRQINNDNNSRQPPWCWVVCRKFRTGPTDTMLKIGQKSSKRMITRIKMLPLLTDPLDDRQLRMQLFKENQWRGFIIKNRTWNSVKIAVDSQAWWIRVWSAKATDTRSTSIKKTWKLRSSIEVRSGRPAHKLAVTSFQTIWMTAFTLWIASQDLREDHQFMIFK